VRVDRKVTKSRRDRGRAGARRLDEDLEGKFIRESRLRPPHMSKKASLSGLTRIY
jgi:hypothetical protein